MVFLAPALLNSLPLLPFFLYVHLFFCLLFLVEFDIYNTYSARQSVDAGAAAGRH